MTDYAKLRDALLADIDTALAVCDAATPGPWRHHGRQILVGGAVNLRLPNAAEWRMMDDLSFYAHARSGYPAALRALRAAVEKADWMVGAADGVEKLMVAARDVLLVAIAKELWHDRPDRLAEFGLEDK